MTRHRNPGVIAAAVLIGGFAAGCSGRPARVRQPSIDAAAAAARALETYDKDRNGSIAGAELDASPALKSALERLDANRDGEVSADEIAERINAWKAMKTALTSVRCLVTQDGRPLPGAAVTFEPESFLGEHVKTATGQTNQFGDAAPTVADADKPDPSLPGGVHFGFYTVRISKAGNGRDGVPARYNTKSTLGLEVAYDEPGIRDNNLAFRLKSTE
ncbi:MAG: hypothetical protein ACKO40_14400 [Planctomycetaceae bacterium]